VKIRVKGHARIVLDGDISFVVNGTSEGHVEAALNDRSNKAIEAAIETAVRSLPTLWGNLEFEVDSISEAQP